MEAKENFMKRAIEVAQDSAKKGDYAVGAVIVHGGKIISVGQTFLKRENDPTAHAEIVAIRNACSKLNTRFLEGHILYTTHEPCPMCASAAIWAKMEGIVFGAFIEDAKGKESKKFSWRQIDIPCKDILKEGHPKLDVVEGFLRKECLKLFDIRRTEH